MSVHREKVGPGCVVEQPYPTWFLKEREPSAKSWWRAHATLLKLLGRVPHVEEGRR